jgi:hypothetical protein
MKGLTALLVVCAAAVLSVGCALPLGEDYVITRDGNAGITYITDYNLQSYVSIPKKGGQPVTIVNDREDLDITVRWKYADGTETALPFDAFAANTVYQAEIKLTPRSDYGFYPSIPFAYPDGKTSLQSDDLGEPTRTVTVTYNNSDDAGITFITNYNLPSYVPVPLAGETPVTTLPGRPDVTIGVVWKVEAEAPNPPGFVPLSGADYTFEEGKVYQADITLTANQDHRFIAGRNFKYPHGMVTIQPDDHDGATVRNLSAVTYMEAMKPTVISDFNLTPYISKPINGILPVTSFAGSQYTGRVSWKNSGTQVVLVGPFQPGTAYTAEVSLTPVLGHTFAGVTQNRFIHTGAGSVSNPADSGEIRVDFSSTGGGGGPSIVYDTNLTSRIHKPIRGEAPVLSVSGSQYTGSVTWVPVVHSTFQYGTVYTAVITLNAVPGYTFTGIGQNVFTHGEASGVINPASSGTVTIVFPVTASSSLSTITTFGPAGAAGSALKLMEEKKADNSVTIDLSDDIEEVVIPDSVILEAGHNSPARVIINGHGRVLKIEAPGTLLTVGGGVTLTLRNITLRGTGGNNAPLVKVHGGKLILGAGAILAGNESTGDAGGVWVNGGELVLYNGGVITGMQAARGAGVLIDTNGQFTMGGGIIGGELPTDGNRASGENGGGGVLVADGTFDMLGGSIQNNSAGASGSGGGVGILNQGTFNLHNGIIKGNKALWSGGGTKSGGGVFLTGPASNSSRGRFNMYGGTIGGDNPGDANEASSGGGGVCVIDADFTMSGGIIKGNNDYGVYFHASSAYNQYCYGSFMMREQARVHENNRVFLASYATITIGGGLSENPAADIIYHDPNTSPASDTKLLRASSRELIEAYYVNFLYNGLNANLTAGLVSDPWWTESCWFGIYQ